MAEKERVQLTTLAETTLDIAHSLVELTAITVWLELMKADEVKTATLNYDSAVFIELEYAHVLLAHERTCKK